MVSLKYIHVKLQHENVTEQYITSIRDFCTTQNICISGYFSYTYALGPLVNCVGFYFDSTSMFFFDPEYV